MMLKPLFRKHVLQWGHILSADLMLLWERDNEKRRGGWGGGKEESTAFGNNQIREMMNYYEIVRDLLIKRSRT